MTPNDRKKIPDPNDSLTFIDTKLDWSQLSHSPHREWLQYYKQLLAIRQREIAPRVVGIRPGRKIARFEVIGRRGLLAHWTLGDGALLTLLANLGDTLLENVARSEGELIFESADGLAVEVDHHRFAPLVRYLVPST